MPAAMSTPTLRSAYMSQRTPAEQVLDKAGLPRRKRLVLLLAIASLTTVVGTAASLGTYGWTAQACGFALAALAAALGGVIAWVRLPLATIDAVSILGVVAVVMLDWSEAALPRGAGWSHGVLLLHAAVQMGARSPTVWAINGALLAWLLAATVDSAARFGLAGTGWARRGGCDVDVPIGDAVHGFIRAAAVLLCSMWAAQGARSGRRQCEVVATFSRVLCVALQDLANLRFARVGQLIEYCNAIEDDAGFSGLSVELLDLAHVMQACRAYVPESPQFTEDLPDIDGPQMTTPNDVVRVFSDVMNRSSECTQSETLSHSVPNRVATVTSLPLVPGSPGFVSEGSTVCQDKTYSCATRRELSDPYPILDPIRQLPISATQQANSAAADIFHDAIVSPLEPGLRPKVSFPANPATSPNDHPMPSMMSGSLSKWSQIGQLRPRHASIMSVAAGVPDAASTNPAALTACASSFAEAAVCAVRETGGQLVALSAHRATAAWNAVTSCSTHQRAACRGATEVVVALCGARQLPQVYGCRCREWWGVGVSTGTLLCGIVGDSMCRRLTAVGDAAEAAANLCELCPRIPTLCLITESTHDAVQGSYPVRPVDLIPSLPVSPCPLHTDPSPLQVVYAMQPRLTTPADTALFALIRMGDVAKAVDCLPPKPWDPVTRRLVHIVHSGGTLGMDYVGWQRRSAVGAVTPPGSERSGDEETPSSRGSAFAVARQLSDTSLEGANNNIPRRHSLRSVTLEAAGRTGSQVWNDPPVDPPGDKEKRKRPSISASIADTVTGSGRDRDGSTCESSSVSADSILCFTGRGDDEARYILAADNIGKGAFGTVKPCLHPTGVLYAAKMVPLPLDALRTGRHTLTLTKDENGKVGMRRDGTRIKRVFEGGPAHAAGLEAGMEIVAVDNTPVRDMRGALADVAELLRACPATFTLDVVDVAHARRYRDAQQSVSDLLAEIEMLRTLRSEHVVPLIDCALVSSYLVIVMEHASGGSLLSVVRSFGPLPVSTVVRYTRGMLRGLELLHRRGIAHRDFKSANVLLGSDGQTKLTDFGCAQYIGRLQSAKADVVGTPLYLSPEACEGRAVAASDIWSLGVVTCELLTGTPPYRMNECQDARAIVARLALGLLRPRIPRQVGFPERGFLKDCLERDPEKRPTASALLAHAFMVVRAPSTAIECPSSEGSDEEEPAVEDEEAENALLRWLESSARHGDGGGQSALRTPEPPSLSPLPSVLDDTLNVE
eukprot:TRINITY_DN8431_c0_g2_i1.p1 TRINITY_DN8431_c0_g2~~TRINITY_DN8431_c0_g2_i1.p1  ORF type:complete len:1239 (+),score=241.38 TRINITY_DN8431_c0_g2_i1:91-3807(+)